MDIKDLYRQVNNIAKPTATKDNLDTKNNFVTYENFYKFMGKNTENLRWIENFLVNLEQNSFKNNNLIIYWQLIKNNAKIPTKRVEDAGLDIYTTDNNVVLKPNETKFFSTGLISSFPSNYWIEIKERGSTGAVGLSVRSGVIDSGYRGEWKIMLTNVNKFPIEFSDKVDKVTYIYGKIFKKRIKKIIYPTSKAIAQAVVIPLPNISFELKDDIDKTTSERGASGWGASGK